MAELGCLPVGRLCLIELAADAQHITLLSQREPGRGRRTFLLVSALRERKFSKRLVICSAQPHDLASMQRALTGVRNQPRLRIAPFGQGTGPSGRA